MENEEVKEEVVTTEPETKGATEQPKEIVFDELDDNIKRYIDQERTKASKTAREHALKDPNIRDRIKAELEKDAQMTVEQKLQAREHDLAIKSSGLVAREYLMTNGGLTGEDLDEALSFVVSDNEEKTLANSESYVTSLKRMIDKATDIKVKEIMQSQPKPKTGKTVNKAFKDMNYNERLAFKQSDPTRFKEEQAKLEVNI